MIFDECRLSNIVVVELISKAKWLSIKIGRPCYAVNHSIYGMLLNIETLHSGQIKPGL